MSKNAFKYPVGIQIVLPEDYKTNKKFQDELCTLKNLGIYGVELNIAHPEKETYKGIVQFLEGFELKFTKFASGLLANTLGLSLSHEDNSIRQKSISKFKEIIDFVAGTETGIIIGFFKGVKVADKNGAIERFKSSLAEFGPYAVSKKAHIYVEATNRYESSVANSLNDAYDIIKDFDNTYIHMLPDTYHMNIEEADMYQSMKKYLKYFNSFHISDNNRYFPGFGAIDFKKVVGFLKKIGYKGGLAIEGNLKNDFVTDISKSCEYLKKNKI